jgi:hypothetical protein
LWGVVPGAWFGKSESQRACRLMLRELMLRDATILMDVVAFARAGYKLFEDCLREIDPRIPEPWRANASVPRRVRNGADARNSLFGKGRALPWR